MLIGLDAADWRVTRSQLRRGKLPQIGSVFRAGAFGPLRSDASESQNPAGAQWMTVATGHAPAVHGVLSDYVKRIDSTGYRGPQQSTMLRVPPIWRVLSDHGVRVGIVGWPVTWPALPLRGVVVAPYTKFRSPGFNSRRTLLESLQLTRTGSIYAGAELRQTHPDAYYREIEADIREAESTGDAQLHADLPTLSPADPDAYYDLKWNYVTNQIVTAVAVPLLADASFDFIALVQYGIDVAFHRAHELKSVDPYEIERHPQLFGVMADYYRYVDRSVGRLLDELSDDTIVMLVSEHGTGGGRHSLQALDGVLAIRGAGVKSRFRIEGASIFDVFPTLLYIYDLPIPRDLPGRVLIEAFTDGFRAARSQRVTNSYSRGEPAGPSDVDFSAFDAHISERLRQIGFADGGQAHDPGWSQDLP